MALIWTPKLSVEVSWIDEEHKELFDRVNKLLVATQALRGRQEIAPVLEFLADYVGSHFANEQQLMQRMGYPEIDGHLEEHAHFIEAYRELAAEVLQNGPSTMVTVKLNRLLVDWLRQHVSTSDRRLGAFLKRAHLAQSS
jgi:hemerythrin